MTIAEQAARHHVLPTTREGDTLIVSPVGDLTGFGTNEMQEEVERIVHFLDDPSIRNVVIDLSNSNYYGTAILSVFVRLKEACREGQTVLCEVSHDMHLVLELFKLEESFPVYESRRKAVSRVARIPLRQRLWAKYSFAKSLTAVVLLVGLIWVGWSTKVIYQIVGTPTQRQYQMVLGLWDEYHSHDVSAWSGEEQAQFRDQAVEQIDRTFAHLQTRAPESFEEANLLAAVSEFKAFLTQDGDVQGHFNSFMHYMYCARSSLRRRTGVTVPVPVSHSVN